MKKSKPVVTLLSPEELTKALGLEDAVESALFGTPRQDALRAAIHRQIADAYDKRAKAKKSHKRSGK